MAKSSINTPQLRDTCVTTEKLVDGAVTTPKISIDPLRHVYYVDSNGDDSSADGSIIHPYKTVSAACTAIGDAADATDYDDDTQKSYVLRLSPGTYSETISVPLRPIVHFEFSAGAVISGNVTQTWVNSLFSGSPKQPQLIFTGVGNRADIDSSSIYRTAGIEGELTIEMAGVVFYQLHLENVAQIGDLIWKRVSGAPFSIGQTFLEDCERGAYVIDTQGSSIIASVWAQTNFSNPDIGDANGIGGLTGSTSIARLEGVYVSGDVDCTGTIGSIIRDTAFKSGISIDLSGYGGTMEFDSESLKRLNDVAPGHGLPASKLVLLEYAEYMAYDTANTVKEAIDSVESLATEKYKTLWVSSEGMVTSETAGAASSTVEYATYSITHKVIVFPGTSQDTHIEFDLSFPETWDNGTIKFRVYWTPGHADADVGDWVRFYLAAGARSDGDGLDAALGTAQYVTDQVLADEDLHITEASAALTIGGTPALNSMIHFKLSRDYDYGSPAMDVDAWVCGLLIQFYNDQTPSAW